DQWGRLRQSPTVPIRRRLARHAGLRPALRMPRWAAGVTATAIAGICIILAVAGVPKPIGSLGDIAANLGRNFLTGFALGAVAYLWFYFWTSDRATRRLRESARRAPERLFPIPPRIGTPTRVVGRERLIDDIITSLRAEFRTGPQVIVGQTGAGKTSFLLGLASRLASEHDVVPIVLTLRDLTKIDFT